jgi:hypothetical protein
MIQKVDRGRLTLVAAMLVWGRPSCIETIENRGSPEPLPPSTATRTIPATPQAAEPATCEEAKAVVSRALERRDEAGLSNATSARERLCRDHNETSH